MLTTFTFNIKAKETDRQTTKENQVRDVSIIYMYYI